MHCNDREDILISSSEDQTLFIFQLLQSTNGTELIPVGFIPTDTVVQQIDSFDCTADKVNYIFSISSSFAMKLIPLSFISIANTCNSKYSSNTIETTHLKRNEKQWEFIFTARSCEFCRDAPDRILWCDDHTIHFGDGTYFMDVVLKWNPLQIRSANKNQWDYWKFKRHMFLCNSVSKTMSIIPNEFDSQFFFTLLQWRIFCDFVPCWQTNINSKVRLQSINKIFKCFLTFDAAQLWHGITSYEFQL